MEDGESLCGEVGKKTTCARETARHIETRRQELVTHERDLAAVAWSAWSDLNDPGLEDAMWYPIALRTGLEQQGRQRALCESTHEPTSKHQKIKRREDVEGRTPIARS